jgi:hypothetical protein
MNGVAELQWTLRHDNTINTLEAPTKELAKGVLVSIMLSTVVPPLCLGGTTMAYYQLLMKATLWPRPQTFFFRN